MDIQNTNISFEQTKSMPRWHSGSLLYNRCERPFGYAAHVDVAFDKKISFITPILTPRISRNPIENPGFSDSKSCEYNTMCDATMVAPTVTQYCVRVELKVSGV